MCQNYSFCCHCVSIIPFLMQYYCCWCIRIILLPVIQFVLQHCVLEQWAVTHQAVVLLVLSGEFQSPFLCSVFFNTFVLFFKCSRQRVNSTFRCCWVYLTEIGEVAFLVWIADCVSTMTSRNQHAANTPWRTDIRYEYTLHGIDCNKLLHVVDHSMLASSDTKTRPSNCCVTPFSSTSSHQNLLQRWLSQSH